MKTLLKITAAVGLALLCTMPTYAERVDIDNPFGIAGEIVLFGGLVGGPLPGTAICTSNCVNGLWDVSILARAYFSGGAATPGAAAGVYTYVYEIVTTIVDPPQGTLDLVTIQSPSFPAEAVLKALGSGFNWGVVDSPAGAEIPFLDDIDTGSNLTFEFEGYTAAHLGPLGTLIVYAQDNQAPGVVGFTGADTGVAGGPLANTLAPVPEPSSFALIAGIGLVAMVLKLRKRAVNS